MIQLWLLWFSTMPNRQLEEKKRIFNFFRYDIVNNLSNKPPQGSPVSVPPLLPPHHGISELTGAESLQSPTHTGPPALGLQEYGRVPFCDKRTVQSRVRSCGILLSVFNEEITQNRILSGLTQTPQK